MQASPLDTFDWFIGSGALTYPWYTQVKVTGKDTADWEVQFIDGADDDSTTLYTLNHQTIMQAVRVIASGTTSVDHVDPTTRDECRKLVFGKLDDVDFDAGTADQVMQFAAFAEIPYC